MGCLMWMIIAIIVYITSFKDEFTKENVDKALKFVTVIGVIVILLGLFLSE